MATYAGRIAAGAGRAVAGQTGVHAARPHGVGRHVAFVGLGENGHKLALARQSAGRVEVLFEQQRGVALVVAAYQVVRTVHAGAVNREPVQHGYGLFLSVNHLEQVHSFVGVVLVVGALAARIVAIGGGAPIDARLQQVVLGVVDSARCQALVSPFDAAHYAIEQSVQCLADETGRRNVVEHVLKEAAWT